jgi:hypothetical protein
MRATTVRRLASMALMPLRGLGSLPECMTPEPNICCSDPYGCPLRGPILALYRTLQGPPGQLRQRDCLSHEGLIYDIHELA